MILIPKILILKNPKNLWNVWNVWNVTQGLTQEVVSEGGHNLLKRWSA